MPKGSRLDKRIGVRFAARVAPDRCVRSEKSGENRALRLAFAARLSPRRAEAHNDRCAFFCRRVTAALRIAKPL